MGINDEARAGYGPAKEPKKFDPVWGHLRDGLRINSDAPKNDDDEEFHSSEIRKQLGDIFKDKQTASKGIPDVGGYLYDTYSISPKDYYNDFYKNNGGVKGYIDSVRDNTKGDTAIPTSFWDALTRSRSKHAFLEPNAGFDYLSAVDALEEEGVPPRASTPMERMAWQDYRRPIKIHVRLEEKAENGRGYGVYHLPDATEADPNDPGMVLNGRHRWIQTSPENAVIHHEMWHNLRDTLRPRGKIDDQRSYPFSQHEDEAWSTMGKAHYKDLYGKAPSADNEMSDAIRLLPAERYETLTSPTKEGDSMSRGMTPEQIKFIMKRTL